MTRRLQRWLACFAVVLGHGCAAVPDSPLQSAWYFQTGPRDKEGNYPQNPIEVALVNRSSRVLVIEKVHLNENEAEESRTWTWTGKAFDLEPGRLRVLPTVDFSRARLNDEPDKFSESCLLPVSVFVEVDKGSRDWLEKTYGRGVTDAKGRVRVDLSGRMPTSLPYAWDRCTLRKE